MSDSNPAASAAAAVLDRDRIISDIAEIVQVPVGEIGDDTNVLDIGLDSVRLMSLIERWRAAGAVHVDVVTLAADPVVGVWIRELAVSAVGGADSAVADAGKSGISS